MQKTNYSLQKTSDELPQYSWQNFNKKMNVSGSRALFTTTVYQRSTPCDAGNSELKFSHRLIKNFSIKLGIAEELETWTKRKNKNTCIWMSDTLPLDLNLQMTSKHPLPHLPTIQILFLGECQHFFMLTVCAARASSEENSALQEKRRGYSLEMAQLLTSALYTFCYCDFILLPCALVVSGKFSIEALETEISEQMTAVRYFYRGPETVNAGAYTQLQAAISAVAGVTYYPCFLGHPNGRKVWMLLLDREWANLLSLVIEAIIHKESEQSVACTPETEFKLKVAVLEAATRLGITDRVVIITTDDRISPSLQRFVAEAEEEDFLDPDLKVVSPVDPTPSAEHVINMETYCIYFRCTVFRFVLLGKTGNGKSATGNTILGQDVFSSDLSFGVKTTKCETKAMTQMNTKIEVMDTPGLYATSKNSKSVLEEICQEVFKISVELDAFFYVIQIDTYTKEEFKVYLNAKAMLGDDVVNHLIVLFTFGDTLKENGIHETLETATKQLKEVLEDCDNRFVVFNNEASDKRPQVEELLEVVRAMKTKNDNKFYKRPNFTPEELEKRLDKAQERLRMWGA